MGVRILHGEADGSTNAAAMYCSSTGWMIGPLWEGAEPVECIEAFLAWLGEVAWYDERRNIFGSDTAHERYRVPLLKPDDPRAWSDEGLEKLVNYFRSQRVDANGALRDECESDEPSPVSTLAPPAMLTGDEGPVAA